MLEAVYVAFYARIVRHVTWSFRLSKDDASEIVQEAFLLALQRVDVSGNPRAWIYRVAENLAANWRRKEDRRSRLLAQFGGAAEVRSEDESQ